MLRYSTLVILLVTTPSLLRAADSDLLAAATSTGPSVFLIGNSLTWDTVPSKLDGDVQWHVDCGKPLTYIHSHPNEPCVKSSTLWPDALAARQYDFLCVQPHYGTTVADDFRVISKWLESQPSATVVIHTGWARAAERVGELQPESDTETLTHSKPYFESLLAQLRAEHPGREFVTTAAFLLLEEVAQDVEAGRAPFESVDELYRDAIHMNIDTGRYLMHNAMRQTLGQPRIDSWSEALDQKTRAYLDSVLDRHDRVQATFARTD